ncbi:transglycosylase SLT domain-containing protein [Flavobacteriaceae bacterium]|nr:transglycosylase SLT domain-containing protein [Flavobacteriaceae bacterium]
MRFWGLMLLVGTLFAQQQNDSIVAVVTTGLSTYKTDNNIVKTTDKELRRLDSLWLCNLYQSSLMDHVFTNENPDTRAEIKIWDKLPTDTLKQRLALLDQKTPFKISYNPELEHLIKEYLKYRRRYYPAMMARASYYLPMFENELAAREIPLEIKYLPIVESALKPRAKSRVGATGLWQFMYQTGQQFDLKISSYVDERQDPIKATKAASKYLEQLYHRFGSWDLALAAYNSGPGNVSKAIRRSGNHTNYWNIRPFLPRETANYVPAFYATMYIMEYAKEHHIYTDKPLAHHFDTHAIAVKQLITFQQIHDYIGTDIELLEFLNPSYKLNIVPFVTGKNYKLVLPTNDAMRFLEGEDAFYTSVTNEVKKQEKPLPKYFEMNKRVRYKVMSGDYLGKIGDMFGVYVRDIKKWNNLKSNNLKVGQSLTIFPKRINYNVPKPSKKMSSNGSKKKTIGKGTKKTHTIVSGESLWTIAQKHNVTVANLRSWNAIWGTNNLKLGSKLDIYQ